MMMMIMMREMWDYAWVNYEGNAGDNDNAFRWEQFCEERKSSMDRFAVEDRRPAEDLEEEVKVKLRLKHAYKMAKKNANKKEKLVDCSI